jgi:hypothetical protein
VLLAVFFSALVGIGFGYYPVRKATYLDSKAMIDSDSRRQKSEIQQPGTAEGQGFSHRAG